MRVLLLHPECSFFEGRFKDVGKKSADEFRAEITGALVELLADYQDLPENVRTCYEIRLSREPLRVFYYRADSEIIVAFPLNGKRSVDTIHVSFQATGTRPISDFSDHFESVWEQEHR